MKPETQQAFLSAIIFKTQSSCISVNTLDKQIKLSGRTTLCDVLVACLWIISRTEARLGLFNLLLIWSGRTCNLTEAETILCNSLNFNNNIRQKHHNKFHMICLNSLWIFILKYTGTLHLYYFKVDIFLFYIFIWFTFQICARFN